MSGFLSFLPDLFGSAFETAAEVAPATLSAADLSTALPAASDFGLGGFGSGMAGAFGGFDPAMQAFSGVPGAGETLPGSMATLNPQAAFTSYVPGAEDTPFIGTFDSNTQAANQVGLSGFKFDPAQTQLAMSTPQAPGVSPPSTPGGGLFDDISKVFKDNKWLLPAGAIGLGLARNAMSKPPPGLGAIKDIASQEAATAAQLSAPLLKGAPLPSGLQAQIDQSKQANEARIRQQYGSMGLSGSTMEAQALQQAEMQAAQAYTQQAMALYDASARALGISSQMDMAIMQQALMQDQQVAQLLGGVAQAAMYGAVK